VIPGGGAPSATTRYALVPQQLVNPAIANPTLNNMSNNIIAPGGSVVGAHVWTASGWSSLGDLDAGEWIDVGDIPAPYGQATMFKNLSANPVTITFVGEVPQGAVNNTWPSYFSFPTGSRVPLAGGMVSTLGYTNQGQAVYEFNKPSGFSAPTDYVGGGGGDANWSEGHEPVLKVGEGVMLQAGPRSWSRNFTVQ